MLSWTPSGNNSSIFDMFFFTVSLYWCNSDVKVSNNKRVTKINWVLFAWSCDLYMKQTDPYEIKTFLSYPYDFKHIYQKVLIIYN